MTGMIAVFLVCLLLLPTGIWLYGHLHNEFHRPRREVSGLPARGILLSSALGMHWSLYMKFHQNHHQHDNGPGDYTTNIKANGQYANGAAYIWRLAIYPSILQCLPGLTVLGMKKANRTREAWISEATRVGIRALFTFILGPVALMTLLVFQTVFAAQIFYINYLQHFNCRQGQAIIWRSQAFNSLATNLGFHDQHHRSPAKNWKDLPTIPPDSKTLERYCPAFDPVAFVAFLISPQVLKRYIGVWS